MNFIGSLKCNNENEDVGKAVNTMSKTRKTNLELLRVLAMFMVIVLHTLGHGGVLNTYTFGQAGYYVIWLIESLCLVAVNCFVLITGYFMVESQTKLSRILKLMTQVWFYSVLSLFVAKFLFKQPIGLKSLVCALFPLTGQQYWFATAYAVLLALTPLINKLIHSMDRKAHLKAIGLLLSVFCVIPTIFFWGRKPLGYGYDFAWFIVLYFVAAYIRLYGISLSGKKCAFGYLLASLIGFASNIVLGIATKVAFGSPKRMDLMFVYNAIPFFVAAVFLFAAFTKLTVKGEFLNWISRAGVYVFGGYLITDHALIREPLWKLINLPAIAQTSLMATVGAVFAVTIIAVVIGCIVEAIRICITKWLGLEKLFEWAENVFNKQINRI